MYCVDDRYVTHLKYLNKYIFVWRYKHTTVRLDLHLDADFDADAGVGLADVASSSISKSRIACSDASISA